MMNNPLTRRSPKLTGSRNPSDLQLLIMIGTRDNKLTFDLLRLGLVKLLVLKNLVLHSMSSWIPHSTSLHLKRIIAVTILTIMKKYDYGHLEEIEVRRDDQKLYKFREGDFP
ncbi:hypothetical protein Tco_1375483 [Tanacetum coccineum]